MSAPTQADQVHLRRADNNERFVAFAFAGADMMAEVEAGGAITYAAGAFRARFGRSPESFVGQSVQDLIEPGDHDAMGAALSLLVGRGRLSPMMIRMADAERTRLALAGIALPVSGRPARLCLTFARPPVPAASVMSPGTRQGFARATEARLRTGAPCDLGLLEIAGPGSAALLARDSLGLAFETVAPHALVGELSPGRYGILGTGGTPAALLSTSHALEELLQSQGIDVQVSPRQLSLSTKGLTLPQAARALRHALNAFARGGSQALEEAGLASGLAGYLERAGRKTDALRRAIRAGRFNLMFQPIVSLATRDIHHFEALIRPQPIPDLPLDSPQEFVMLIEALGLADELDIGVARLACDEALRAGRSVAFNLSGQSVQNPAFRARLIALLTDHPARKAGLAIVEMTETAEIDDLGEAAATAEALRAIDVSFCLDDFGSGMADMRLLRALTANIVKLDGSYIIGVTKAGRERAFVAGMVEIARAVGAEIVAERIETEPEATVLADLGVQYGQGWLFGRPGSLPSPGQPRVRARAGEVESWG